MSTKTAIRALLVALLWLSLMGALAVGYRFFVSAETKQRIQGVPELSDKQWHNLAANMQIEPLVFTRGSVELSDEGRRKLDELAMTLRKSPQVYVRIIGQARRAGDASEAEANALVARARAQVVSDFLNGGGISVKRLSVATETSVESAQTVRFEIGEAR